MFYGQINMGYCRTELEDLLERREGSRDKLMSYLYVWS